MSPLDDPAPLGTVTVGKAGDLAAFTFDDDLRATFDFSGRIGQESYSSVSPAQQIQFQKDFEEQLKEVRRQLSAYKDRDGKEWLPAAAPLSPRVTSGPYRARADFHVVVSEVYTKSSSLLPAWFGRRGWMEFPATRVAAREASVAHEIAHLLFPNGNRMLDEGLAVYLQYKLFPTLPVWPNFGMHPNVLVAQLLQTYSGTDSQQKALWYMDLDAFERISTPDLLSLRIGTDSPIGTNSDQEKAVYGVAGSIVGFLLDNLLSYDLLTEENFGSLYKSTPLRPRERDSGAAGRWQEYYRDKEDRKSVV